jgi:FlgD Ig-like domain
MKTRLVIPAVLSLFLHPVITQAAWTTDGNPVCTATGVQTIPQVVSDGSGGAIVTWEDARGTDKDIYAQRIDASGTVLWTTNGVAICTASDDQEYPAFITGVIPEVISDGAGGAIMTWQDHRNGTDYDIYAQRVDASGAVQWTTNGVALCTAARDQLDPTMVSDGAGGAIITWVDYRQLSHEEIYAQRIDASGTVQWTANGVYVDGNNDVLAAIVEDGSGGAIIAWEDFAITAVRAQRVNASGATQWLVPTQVCYAVDTSGGHFPIISDGAGGAIIAWQDTRNQGVSQEDIYVQRVNGSGFVQWTTDGVPVITWGDDQEYPAMVTDGAGGAIVAWEDYRGIPTDDEADIFMQRIDSGGTLQWSPEDAGHPEVVEPGDQLLWGFVPDGSGGAVITWDDWRQPSGEADVYAQRVDGTGFSQWVPSDGVAICTASGSQFAPELEWDGDGGIVAWEDHRGDMDSDIYAQWLSASGSVAAGVHDTPSASEVALSPNFPNPFSGETTVDLTLRRDEPVTIEVFDAAGRRVREIDKGDLHKGDTQLVFDGRDDRAHVLPSGVYFYRVHAGGETVTRKMVITR